MMKLMYPMTTLEKAVKVDYDTAHFGWLKFESSSEAADELTAALKANKSILRSIVFRTVREDTRAKIKAPTLREVKRETPVHKPKRIEEVSAPVSEVDLDKALEGLTAE